MIGSDSSNKVLSITMNTAIDFVIEVDELQSGSAVRSRTSDIAPAGKGVNAAVGVATLGTRAVATGFIGAESFQLFQTLQSEKVEARFVELPGATRTNVTILENSKSRETHIQTDGYSVSALAIDKLISILDREIQPGDVVLVAGSLPPSAPPALAGDLISLAKANRAYTILDSNGTGVLNGIKSGPDMIKANLDELSEVCNRPVEDSDETIAGCARELLSSEINRVIVSRGYRGIILVEKDAAWKAFADNVATRFTAGVGCGDAVVAAFAHSIVQSASIEDTLLLAVACGSANLLTTRPGRFQLADVEAFKSCVTVQRLS